MNENYRRAAREPGAGPAISLMNTLSQQDFGGTGAVRVTAGGRIEQPAD